MTIQGIRPGDIVYCERNGMFFYAKVKGKGKGIVDVDPITKNVNYFTVKTRQVKGHYRKSKASVI